jgi:hypothetical protein
MSFPASPVRSGCSDFPLPVPPRSVSFARRYRPTSRRRQKELPGSWGTPMHACPALRPRWDRRARSSRHPDTAFRLFRRRRLPPRDAFEAPSRGLHTPCVRFTSTVTRRRATLGSGCGPALPGGIGYPLGSTERFPSSCSHYMTSPFPRLRLAHRNYVPFTSPELWARQQTAITSSRSCPDLGETDTVPASRPRSTETTSGLCRCFPPDYSRNTLPETKAARAPAR